LAAFGWSLVLLDEKERERDRERETWNCNILQLLGSSFLGVVGVL
jgi:hypothetical protein